MFVKTKELVMVTALFVAAFSGQAMLWWLFWRTSTPIVMGDEFRFARDIFSQESTGGSFSNYLFSNLYGAVVPESESWYEQIKLLNSAVWATAVVPIFAMLRAIATPFVAGWGALFVTLLPVAIFSATVLPEILFYVCAFTSLAFFVWMKDRYWMGLLVGASLGIGMLVKPHAVFLLIALLVAMFFVRTRVKTTSIKTTLVHSLAIVSVALVVRFGGGAIFFGPASFDFIGEYASVDFDLLQVPSQLLANGSTLVATAAPQISEPLFLDVVGPHVLHYLLAFFVVYLIPTVAVIINLPSKRHSVDSSEFPRLNLMAATLATVLFLSLISFAFGIYVSLTGDDHTSRVLFRYVDYLFGPLILAAVLAGMSNRERPSNSKVGLSIATGLSGVALFVVSSLTLDLNPADSAVLTSFIENPVAWLLSASAIVLPVVLSNSSIRRVLVPSALAGFAVASSVFIANVGSFYNQELSYLLGKKDLGLSEIEENKVLFVSTSNFLSTSTMMLSSSFDSTYKLVAPFSQIDVGVLGEQYEAVVLIGAEQTVFTNGSPLTGSAATRSYRTVASEPSSENEIFVKPEQVGVSTDWGFWVDGERLEIALDKRLSEGMNVEISMRKHPLWQNGVIRLSVGGETVELALEDTLSDQTLSLELQDAVDGRFVIEAISPQDLSGEYFIGEQSVFGVGLVSLEVDGVSYFKGG